MPFWRAAALIRTIQSLRIALAIASVVISVPLAFHVSFIGALEQMISGSPITAIVGYPALVASAAVRSTLYSCHFVISLRSPGRQICIQLRTPSSRAKRIDRTLVLFAHVGRQTFDVLDKTAGFYSNGLGKQGFRTLGGVAAQGDLFRSWCAQPYQFQWYGKRFDVALASLQLVLTTTLFSRHVQTPLRKCNGCEPTAAVGINTD